jgi:uncharacterized protein (TIGR02996 family)
MIRYENKGRFWEIAARGCQVVTRHGRVGSDGKTNEKELKSEKDVARELEKRIRATEKKGYERVVTGGEEPQPVNPDLEQAIIADPRSVDAYLVYADWLQSQGDPRGELAALQHALITDPGQSKKVERSTAALFKERRAYFLPPRWTEMLRKRPGKGKHEAGYCAVEWRCGFIHRARVGRNSNKPPYTVRELTAMLLAHPSARLLCELEIGGLGVKDELHDYSDVLQVISEARLPALRRLVLAYLDPGQCEPEFAKVGDVSTLATALPGVEQLALRGGDLAFDEGVSFECLTELDLESPLTLEKTMRALAQHTLRAPRLAALTLRFNRRTGNARAAESLFAALAESESLTRLGLVECENASELLAALLKSPLAGKLRELSLAGGTLTDNQSSRLVEAAPDLELARLDVDGNYLTETARPGLEKLAGELTFGTQRRRPVGGLNEDRVRRFAGSPKTMASARSLADVEKWNAVGFDHGTLWGEYTGSSSYEVYARVEGNDGACTCPSFRYPCKHAVALMLMAAQGQAIPDRNAPAGLVARCDEQRYSTAWE